MGTQSPQPALDAADENQRLSRLSEEDAWDIAMAWEPQLQGKVRLVVDRDGPLCSIVESYAWVRLDTPRPLSEGLDDDSGRLEVVSVMRAVMLSWTALAACPGFRGSENAAFWKRVMRKLLQLHSPEREYMRRHQRLEPVTDAHAFFDLPGHVFPRFLVELPFSLDGAFGSLFTRDGPCLSASVSSTLQSHLEHLGPFMHVASPQIIDICLFTELAFGNHDQRLRAFVRAVDEPTHQGSGPHFRIGQIQIKSRILVSSNENIEAIVRFVRDVPVSIRQVHLVPRLDHVSHAGVARLLRALLRLSLDERSVQATVSSLKLSRHHVHDALFQALMSALPFATSIHSLAVRIGLTERERMFEHVDLPWIAYAIFHPRAECSSWRHLEMDALPLTPHTAFVLTAMARGNNLVAVLSGRPPDSDAYFSAEIAKGTRVQFEPRAESRVLLVTSLTFTTIDVCGITSLDRASWGDWVAVMVPAYGLGWVRINDLHNEQAHAPAKPSLTGLQFRRNIPPEFLLHLLPPLGSALTYLNIGLGMHVSASTLHEILRLCPSLKVLAVKHAGELWSERHQNGIAPCETQLEELELVVPVTQPCVETPTRDAIATLLRQLRALRIRIPARRGDHLQASRAALEQVLCHAVSLRYLHWQRLRLLFPSTPRVEVARTTLEELDLGDPTYLYAQLPLSPSCAIAFLSVVTDASQHGGSTLGKLVDRGVLMIIFQFATTPVRRSICIEEDNTAVAVPVVVNIE